MEILDLNLANFRNFSNKKFNFDKNLTVIIGPNGSGKSNILEAISLICGQRPLRVETDLDLVKFGMSEVRIRSRVQGVGFRGELTINFQVIDERSVRKSYLIDGLKKRLVNFLDLLSIVVFHPEDLDLVAGSPSLRRHHLDLLLSSGDRDYWRNISSYNKVVTRRNKILNRIADGKSKPLELNFWDGRLLEHAKYISKRRQEFFEFLNFVEGGSFAGSVTTFPPAPRLSSGQASAVYPERSRRVGSPSSRATRKTDIGSYTWELRPSLITEEKLLKNRERDIAAGVTLSGPHRDDFRFIFKKKDLAYFGSRGEQRMAVLALKLSELEYLRVQKGRRPILALDDIFSELDWQHRETVLSVVGNQQTIITAAERDSVPKNLLKKAKVIEL